LEKKRINPVFEVTAVEVEMAEIR